MKHNLTSVFVTMDAAATPFQVKRNSTTKSAAAVRIMVVQIATLVLNWPCLDHRWVSLRAGFDRRGLGCCRVVITVVGSDSKSNFAPEFSPQANSGLSRNSDGQLEGLSFVIISPQENRASPSY